MSLKKHVPMVFSTQFKACWEVYFLGIEIDFNFLEIQ
jgi:hypothetical protein